MSYLQKENCGSLFENNKKEKDTHPDYNGTINVAGTEYWLSAWIKPSKNGGSEWYSLSVKPKEAANVRKIIVKESDRPF